MKKRRALAELDRIMETMDQDPDAAWKRALAVCAQYRNSRNWLGRTPSALDLQDLEFKMNAFIDKRKALDPFRRWE